MITDENGKIIAKEENRVNAIAQLASRLPEKIQENFYYLMKGFELSEKQNIASAKTETQKGA